MFDRVVFFNGCHRGDVFMSRGLVKQVMRHVPAKAYVYDHPHHRSLLKDISGLQQLTQGFYHGKPRCFRWQKQGDEFIVNASYMVGTEYFESMELGTSFLTLKRMLEGELNRALGLTVKVELTDLISDIDFSSFEIGKADEFLRRNNQVKVYVANCDPCSAQTDKYSLDPIIDMLSKKFPNVLFLYTNKPCLIQRTNVLFTGDIIGLQDNNLMENAFVAQGCDLVFSRGSGPGTVILNKGFLFHSDAKVVGNAFCFNNVTAGVQSVLPNKFVLTKSQHWPEIERVIREELEHIIRSKRKGKQ